MHESEAPESGERKKKGIMKRLFVAISVIVSVLLLALLIRPLVLAVLQGDEAFENELESMGAWGPLVFLLLQILQIVIAFIPGEPFPAIGAVLFGEDFALFLCLLGCFLGTVIVYFLVQRFGKSFVAHFVPERYYAKYNDLLNGKNLYLIIFIVFLLPGLPKDVLTYLVAFHPALKKGRFFLLTTLGRAPAIAMTIYLGKSLWSGKLGSAIAITLALIVLFALGVFAKRLIERRR